MTPICLKRFLCTLAILAAWLSLAQAMPMSYHVTALGSFSYPKALSNMTNLAVGMQQDGSNPEIAMRFAPTSLTLGTLPNGNISVATGVADQMIIGYSSVAQTGFPTHAFKYTSQAGLIDLGTTGSDPNLSSFASAINATATIVGAGDTPDRSRTVALLWPPAGAVITLPSLTTGICWAFAISDDGDAVGYCTASNGQAHAVMWPIGGGIQDLHTGGYVTYGSYATGINSALQITGTMDTTQGARAFVWLPIFGMLPLSPLSQDTVSAANGINSAGVVVGKSSTPNTTCRCPDTHSAAVRWDNGAITNLQTMLSNGEGWTLQYALAINEEEYIIGIGEYHGERQGFLLTPETTPAFQALVDAELFRVHVGQNARIVARRARYGR